MTAALSTLFDEIARAVGPSAVSRPSLDAAEALRSAALEVRPASTEEVARVMSLCHRRGFPVVVQGGLTGLVRGAEATGGEVALSCARLRTIESCDPAAWTMTVQTGVTLQQVQERAAAEGTFFPVDMGSRGSCTIGGNIATNAGGTRVIRYGMMREHVLGLEVVLADGSIVASMNSLIKNNTGYDLKQLFIGSEGTLGLITRAVLRLQPRPRSEQTALVALTSFDHLLPLLRLAREELWGTLSAFEVMWRSFYRLVTIESGRHGPPLPADFPFYALVESQGGNPQRDRGQFEGVLARAAEEGLIADAVIAEGSAQRQKLWALREETASLRAALRPPIAFDVSLPLVAMDRYTTTLEREIAARWPGAGRCVVFGHLGDGNLHVVVTTGSADPDTRAEVEHLVYAPLSALGGSISAEHGIGLEKRPHLRLCRTEGELMLMRSLKQALDPHDLLNPGKVLPPQPAGDAAVMSVGASR